MHMQYIKLRHTIWQIAYIYYVYENGILLSAAKIIVCNSSIWIWTVCVEYIVHTNKKSNRILDQKIIGVSYIIKLAYIIHNDSIFF